MQKFLVLLASVLVILLGLEAVTEALPLSDMPADEQFADLDLLDDVNEYVKRISDNDYAQLKGQSIERLARDRQRMNRQIVELLAAGKRSASDNLFEKRNLSQNDLSQHRSNYMNQMLAWRMTHHLLNDAGRR